MDLLFLVCLLFTTAKAYRYYEPSEELKPCPKTVPVSTLDLNKLNGRWYLSVLILDSATEDLEESEICVNGNVVVKNSTHMKQTWDMYSPSNAGDPVGTIEFGVTVVGSGIWRIQTPLGSELSASVFGIADDFVMVAYCGWHKNKLIHVWTGGATRKNNLTPELRIKISSLLLDNGYDPQTTKIITWSSKC